MYLKIFESIPDGFLASNSTEVHDVLGGPSIIDIGPRDKSAIFVSALLHGNEYSGLLAIQRFLQEADTLNHRFIFLIGNTLAAKYGQRHLINQHDFNRIWSGGISKEHKMAEQVLAYVKGINLIACIDIHNNTGKNPIYSCINVLTDSFLNLAQIFCDQVVYFTEPHTVLSRAFAKLCPAVVIEAGAIGNVEGVRLLTEKIHFLNKNESLPYILDKKRLNAYHTIGIIKVDPDSTLDFDNDNNSESTFSFINDFDDYNFTTISENTKLGITKAKQLPEVMSNDEHDITDNFFSVVDNAIVVKRSFVPSMFTKDITIAKSDCLGYIMESIKL